MASIFLSGVHSKRHFNRIVMLRCYSQGRGVLEECHVGVAIDRINDHSALSKRYFYRLNYFRQILITQWNIALR